jgi:L-rhamnose-H+ transport protein
VLYSASPKEFNFSKGLVVATFSGVMSACFSFALTAGAPIGDASAAAGTSTLWTGLPKLVVVLLGGFTTNFIWCVLLNLKNRTGYQYLAAAVRPEHAGLQATGGEHGGGATATASASDLRVPRFGNYFFSALAGTTWYFQFFFYTMGETQMGKYGFASWTLHMASIIIFSTMWGWIFHEWKGSSKKAHGLIAVGIFVLILSTVIIGYGTYLKGGAGGH